MTSIAELDLAWPPAYTMRRSARAKRLALRVHPDRGLEIVLPMRASKAQGVMFLEEQRAWVEAELRAFAAKKAAITLPNQIYFPCVDQRFEIDYIQISAAKRVSLKEKQQRLIIYGQVDQATSVGKLLSQWVKQKAKAYLPIMLIDIAQQSGLMYKKVCVRTQKTLWGSCSDDKSINLNFKLILLPEKTVRYVMIHELCHTIHMNHSADFWSLVERYLPDYREIKSQMKQADDWLPSFLLHGV